MSVFLSPGSHWDSDKLRNVSEDLKNTMQRGIEEKAGYASVLLKSLREEVKKFESTLSEDESTGTCFTSLIDGQRFIIEYMYPQDPYFIVIEGYISGSDEKAKLVQHVNQISILFVSVKMPPSNNQKAKRIGFIFPEED
jgi:hypothetical protein